MLLHAPAMPGSDLVSRFASNSMHVSSAPVHKLDHLWHSWASGSILLVFWPHEQQCIVKVSSYVIGVAFEMTGGITVFHGFGLCESTVSMF